MMVAKCRIVTADWKELDDKVVKNLKSALSAVGVKLFELDSKGDWYALAVCSKDATKKDAEKAFDRWRSR